MMKPGAVILCGGESRRMGRPKAWLPFGGERLLQRVVRIVSSGASPVIVVAAPEQELPPLPSEVFVARDSLKARGPLEGLAAGLSAMPETTELVFATATDVPFLVPGWIGRLVDLIGESQLAIPHCNEFFHPLAALYRREPALRAITELLAADRLRPIYLTESLRTRLVTHSDLADIDPGLLTLRNLNTPEDYAQALRELRPECSSNQAEGLTKSHAMVRIELFGIARLRAGVGQFEVDAATLGEAIELAGRACPSLMGSVIVDGRLHPAYTVNLNGDRFISELDTQLRPGDSLLILSVDVGG